MKTLALAIITVLMLAGSAFAEIYTNDTYPEQEFRFTWSFDVALEPEISGFQVEIYNPNIKPPRSPFVAVAHAPNTDRELIVTLRISPWEVTKYFIGAVYLDGFVARFGPVIYRRHPIPTSLTVEGQ